jgi:hypothetical protein
LRTQFAISATTRDSKGHLARNKTYVLLLLLYMAVKKFDRNPSRLGSMSAALTGWFIAGLLVGE